MKTFRLLFLMLSILALLASAHPTLAETPSTVSPEVGPPGTRFLFFAAGFAPDEQLSFWVNRPDGSIQAIEVFDGKRSSTAGEAVWTWTAPQDAPRGGWQMVAHGRKSAVERVIAFTIGDPPAPYAPPPYNVTPRSGLPGTLFVFYAAGFTAREFVDVQVRGPDGTIVPFGDSSLVVSEPATDGGRIDGSWTSPASAAPGNWQIVAHGAESGVTQTMTLTIASRSSTPAQLTAVPNEGVPGMRFSFSGAGFTPDEEIKVWLNLPDGRVVPTEVEGNLIAAPDGRVGWTWVAPADGPLGGWQMVAHGLKSGVEAVASFTLRAP
jgi:hypothetical protein